MARYIDADALLNNLPDDLPYKASVKRVLIQAPAADVVPKSEVEEMMIGKANSLCAKFLIDEQEGRGKAFMAEHDRELARGIFEDIEKVIGEQYEKYVFDNIEIEGVEQDAIIAFADKMKFHFAELKKKYGVGGQGTPVPTGEPGPEGEPGIHPKVAEYLLSEIKKEAHNKAVHPCGCKIDPYISLKVLDGIIQKYINKYYGGK